MAKVKGRLKSNKWLDVALWNMLCEVAADDHDWLQRVTTVEANVDDHGAEFEVDITVNIGGRPYNINSLIENLGRQYQQNVATDASELVRGKLTDLDDLLEVIRDVAKSRLAEVVKTLPDFDADYFIERLEDL